MIDEDVVFTDGWHSLVLFLFGLAAAVTVVRLFEYVWTAGPTIPVIGVEVLALAVDLTLLVLVGWVLRREGVAPAALGMSVSLVVPGIIAVVLFYVALNLVGFGLGLVTVGPSVIGYQWSVPPTAALAEFVYVLVAAGIVEEVAFRGYLQSKLVALIGDRSRRRIGLGIITASLLFVVSHAPRVVFNGVPGSQSLATYAALLFVSGAAFGVVYELTQNLTIPILVHAAGNMPGTLGIVFFDVGALPAWATITYLLAYVGLVGLLIGGYRRWGRHAGVVPVWGRRRTTSE